MKRKFSRFTAVFIALTMALSMVSAYASSTQEQKIGDTVSWWLLNDDFERYTGKPSDSTNKNYFGDAYASVSTDSEYTSEFATVDAAYGQSLHIAGIDKNNCKRFQYVHDAETSTNYANVYRKFTDFGPSQSERLVINFDLRRTKGTRTPEFYLRSGKGNNADIARFFFDNGGGLVWFTGSSSANTFTNSGNWKAFSNTDVWHSVKLIYDRATMTVEYYIDGAYVTTALADLDAAQNGTYVGLRIENPYSNGTKYECYLDNYKVGYADAQLKMSEVLYSKDEVTSDNGKTNVQIPVDYIKKDGNYVDIKGKNLLLSADVTINWPGTTTAKEQRVSISLRGLGAGSNTSWLVCGLVQGDQNGSNGNYMIWKNISIEGANGTCRNIAEATMLNNSYSDNALNRYFYKGMNLFKSGEKVNLKFLSCVNSEGTAAKIYIYANDQLIGVNDTSCMYNAAGGTLTVDRLIPAWLVVSDQYWDNDKGANVTNGITSVVENIRLGYLADTTPTLFRVVNENGSPVADLDSVEETENLYIDARIKSNCSTNKEVLPIFASYDDEGMITVVPSSDTVVLETGKTLAINKNNQSPVITASGANEISAFLWNGFGAVTPYAEKLNLIKTVE